MQSVITFIFLSITWIIFSGAFDAFHLSLGLISCAFVTWTSHGTIFSKNPHSIPSIIGIGFRLIPYLLWLVYEILAANLHVFYLVLHPSGLKHVKPQIVTFKTNLKSDYARVLLANSITLTPGTVTINMIQNELLVHSISIKTTVSLEGDMEKKIAWVFGETPEEKA